VSYFLLSQLVGFIALFISTLAFQIRNQKSMFLIVELSNFIWAIHYIMLGGYTAAFVMVLSIIRTILVLYRPKFKIHAILIALGFNLLFCIFSPESYWYKYIPFVTGVLYSLSLYYNELYLRSRLLTFVAMTMWLIYGIMIVSYPEVTESLFIMASILIGIIRHSNNQNKKTTP
jgi:hypothetical protein